MQVQKDFFYVYHTILMHAILHLYSMFVFFQKW